MTIYKRGTKWIAQVHDESTGRNRHLGTFGTKRDAAKAEATAYETRVRVHELVSSFIDRWTRDYPRADSTNKHNSERVRRFRAAYGDKRLDAITRQQARTWALENKGEHSALRAMFTDALRDDLVHSNPFANLGVNRKKPKRKIEPGWMTAEDISRLAAAAHLVHRPGTADIVSSAILVSAYTGIRPGELFALERTDVVGNQLVISKAIRSNTKTLGTPKNGRTRTIVLPEIAAEAIEHTPRNHETLVFTTARGKQLYQPGWYGMWNPARVAAGFPNMQYYELRHWCATHLIELGLSPSDVAIQMGHTDGGILVQQVYSHAREDHARSRILDATSRPQHDHNIRTQQAQ